MTRVQLHGGPHDGLVMDMAEAWNGRVVLVWNCSRHGLQPPADCDCEDAQVSFYANEPDSALTFEVLEVIE